MSEPVLKAIIQLFALVAKEDGVTLQERDHIKVFLLERLSQQVASNKLALFDRYSQLFSDRIMPKKESEIITSISTSINKETVQKQKVVIMMELIGLILADGIISPREYKIAHIVGNALHIKGEDIELIKLFLSGKVPNQLDSENILIISSDADTERKYKHILRQNIKGFIAFLYLQSVKMYFFKHIGQTDIFLNGVPKKPEDTNTLAVGSTLRWEGAPAIYYRDVLAQFKKLKTHQKLSFEAHNIYYTFKNGHTGLQNINISEESGNLIAIMGSSGSGKSTLLHVLNGLLKPTEGDVLINRIDIHKHPDQLEGVIGFVPQDDMLIEDLTVYQNLRFAAQFCFNNLSIKKLDNLAYNVLESIGLVEIKDFKVGSVLKRTISGGQRKRLNIGLELIREPAVLFCDEPTSGLSSRDSENILDLLKELSLKGKLIFTVIHQPSSSIFKMFDKLLILDTGGYQIYYDNPVDAVTYFKRSINSINSKQGECNTCGNVNPEQIFNIIETKIINEYGKFSNERRFSPKDWAKNHEENSAVKKLVSIKEKPHTSLHIPGWIKQTRLFLLRDVLAKANNTQYVLINLLEAPLLAFILSVIVRFHNPDDPLQDNYTFGGNINIPSYFFISVIVAIFMGLTVSAEEIIRDSQILKRESFLHLNRGSYLLSKVLILFSISAIQTLSFVLVGNYILKIEGMLFTHWMILFSTSCFANMLGLNISSAFNSAVTIYILIPILIIPQLILSGSVVKFDKLNPAVSNSEKVPTIGNIVASRWAFEATMVAQFKDNDFEKKFYPFDKRIAMSEYKRDYYIPYLETTLNRVYQYYKNASTKISEKDIESDFFLLRNEIGKELDEMGNENFSHLNSLYLQQYDSTVHMETKQLLSSLKQEYIDRYSIAQKEKEDIIQSMTRTPSERKKFEKNKVSNQNKAIAALVKNSGEFQCVVRHDDRLAQKIFSIYRDPNHNYPFDLSAPFYTPKKYFINQNIDTLIFNIGVIWSMVFFLFIALYFKVLRKIVDVLGGFFDFIPKRV